jgi:hypothetical protein
MHAEAKLVRRCEYNSDQWWLVLIRHALGLSKLEGLASAENCQQGCGTEFPWCPKEVLGRVQIKLQRVVRLARQDCHRIETVLLE